MQQASVQGKVVNSGASSTNIDPRVTAKILSVAREELEKCPNVTSDIDHIFKQTETFFREAQNNFRKGSFLSFLEQEPVFPLKANPWLLCCLGLPWVAKA